jgi:periplasmic divalent cation tolerance protein
MAAVWVYVTTADQAEAERLGRAAVEARLAACANLLGPTTAVYWWEGKVESGTEAALVLKTRAGKDRRTAQLRLSLRGGAADRRRQS